MPSEDTFSVLIRGLRAGDASAVRELVNQYEPYLRRTLRRRLARSPLQAVADSVDLCNSVLGAFLIRFVAGEYDVATQEDLTKLLLGIAKKKFAKLCRREAAQRRDRSQSVSLGSDPNIADERLEEPSVVLERNELLSQIQQRMAESELELYQLRREGYTWEEIAQRLDEPAARLAKRLSRALHEICHSLKLESSDDEL